MIEYYIISQNNSTSIHNSTCICDCYKELNTAINSSGGNSTTEEKSLVVLKRIRSDDLELKPYITKKFYLTIITQQRSGILILLQKEMRISIFVVEMYVFFAEVPRAMWKTLLIFVLIINQNNLSYLF